MFIRVPVRPLNKLFLLPFIFLESVGTQRYGAPSATECHTGTDTHRHTDT